MRFSKDVQLRENKAEQRRKKGPEKAGRKTVLVERRTKAMMDVFGKTDTMTPRGLAVGRNRGDRRDEQPLGSVCL